MGIRGYANFFGQQGVSVFYLLVCLYSAEPKTERQMKMALYGSAIGAGEGSPVDQNYNWLLPVRPYAFLRMFPALQTWIKTSPRAGMIDCGRFVYYNGPTVMAMGNACSAKCRRKSRFR